MGEEERKNIPKRKKDNKIFIYSLETSNKNSDISNYKNDMLNINIYQKK